MPLPEHLFSGSNGHLYDTRLEKWSKQKPLREFYSFTWQSIKTVAQLKSTLRRGSYAWPGGYPLYLLCSDGGSLCFDCGKKELRQIIDAIRYPVRNDGWKVVACDLNYEDSEMQCAHCNKRIESAYDDNKSPSSSLG